MSDAETDAGWAMMVLGSDDVAGNALWQFSDEYGTAPEGAV